MDEFEYLVEVEFDNGNQEYIEYILREQGVQEEEKRYE